LNSNAGQAGKGAIMMQDLQFLTAMGRLSLYLIMITGGSLFLGSLLIVAGHLMAWRREYPNA
jgi:hypothetical protein